MQGYIWIGRGQMMNIKNKLTIAVGVCVALIVALIIGVNWPKNKTNNNNENNNLPEDNVVENVVNYTYKASDIELRVGGSVVDYYYNPLNESAKPVVAYEYALNNSSDEDKAVHLDKLHAEGVTISFAYFNQKWNGISDIQSEGYYTAQLLPVGNDSKYIYLLIAPEDKEILSAFNANIAWKYGRAQSITINNNINLDVKTQTIVSGQKIDELVYNNLIGENGLPKGYYFDGWFLDADYSIRASLPLVSYGETLYARFANLPQKNTKYMAFDKGGYKLISSPDVENLIIPTTYDDGINGKADVVGIDNKAFYLDSKLVSVEFSSGIKTIGESAFNKCKNLSKVNLTACVYLTDVGNYAFRDCKNLTEILLSKRIKSFGEYAFSGCSSLTSIDLSDCADLQTINQNAFSYCSQLQSIDFTACNKLITISDSVFFDCVNLSDVKLPTNLINLGSGAFYNCSSLTAISIPIGVTTIADNTFYYSGLVSIDLSKCANLVSIGSSAFRGCTHLYAITIPMNVTVIGSDAFNGCISLVSVIMPKQLIELRDYAFYNCSNLVSADLTNCTNLTTVGKDVFKNCDKLNAGN